MAEAEEKLRLGGMALRNGLLIHGPTHWAAAVRAPDGTVQVASERKPELAPGLAARLPGLRGPLRLAEALAVLPLVRRRLPAARLPFEDLRVLGAVVATLVATTVLRKRLRSSALRETAVQAIGAVPAVVALLDRDLAAYHGVEHKAIAAYEQGTDAADAAKEHDRCGSNLVTPMLLSTIAGNIVVRSLFKARGPLAGVSVALGSVALSVEMFAWSERHPDRPLARAFHRPGFEMQRLFATREPTPEQLQVGRVAMAEILRLELPPA